MTLSVATLGGPGTFAGRAAAALARRHPELGEPAYRPSMEALWQALEAGEVDVVVLSSDSTRAGPGDSARRILRFPAPVQVLAELLLPYRCSLLARPGTELADVRTVLGHGSVRQCRPFLDARLPQAEVRILHDLNSEAAAQLVAEGDGSSVVVGTPEAGAAAGLVELARDVDGGAVGLWWAISRVARPATEPRRLLVRGRLGGDGGLGALATALGALGFRLTTCFSLPGGEELFEYDYLLAFEGDGAALDDVRARLEPFERAYLVAALPPLSPVPRSEQPT